MRYWFLAVAALVGVAVPSHAETVTFAPGPDIQTVVQEAFILSEPGTVFVFAEGTYSFTMQLSIDLDEVTVRGAGMDKTIFDFSTQDMGSEGIFVTGDGVTLEDFAILDTPGDGFKCNDVKDITLRRVRAEWTGGPKESNGAYGLYPVSSENVLVEECVAIGASDAGIYVGQSRNIIVRNSRAEYNVAGIEIENCYDADVYGNTATHNTGGVLVFDLPGLPQQGGRNVRAFNNTVVDNNTTNFAPKGNIVAQVPTGTGIMVMANRNVEIFGNTIENHQTTNIVVCSYYATGIPIQDAKYFPYPENIHIHGNTFGKAGHKPAGELGLFAALYAGLPLPDILWDGVVSEERLAAGEIPANGGLIITENEKREGEALTFVNMNGDAAGSLENMDASLLKRDLAEHVGSLPALPPVKIPGVE
jgi:parallel beta-helix repeat protein